MSRSSRGNRGNGAKTDMAYCDCWKSAVSSLISESCTKSWGPGSDEGGCPELLLSRISSETLVPSEQCDPHERFEDGNGFRVSANMPWYEDELVLAVVGGWRMVTR